MTTTLTGRPPPGRNLRDALTSGVATLIEAHATEAGERTAKDWAAMPAGEALSAPALAQPRPRLRERGERLVRDWQRRVRQLVATEGAQKRKFARISAYTVNATGLLVMVGVFASTAFIPTGAEVALAGGTTVAAQKLLEAVFGDEAMRQLATAARDDLIRRVRELLMFESARFGDVRKDISLDPGLPERLREAAGGRRPAPRPGRGQPVMSLPGPCGRRCAAATPGWTRMH